MNAKAIAITAAFTVLSSSHCLAQGTFSWSFDQTVYWVGPSEKIVLSATLENLTSNPIFIDSVGGIFNGNFQKTYNFTPDDSLSGRTVPTLGTLEFQYGVLTPVGGFVIPGTYKSDPAFLVINGGPDTIASKKHFDVQVVPEPEPGTIVLLGLGCIYVNLRVTFRRSRRQVNSD